MLKASVFALAGLSVGQASYLRPHPVSAPTADHGNPSLTANSLPASLFVGAQHWNESGWYADSGFKQHYDGYFCLCSCNGSEEGVFCSGAGVHPDGTTKVADFLGVFSEDRHGGWVGDLVAYNNTTPFSDHFTMDQPGGRANYTGVSQALGAQSFVWRGYMSGVDCAFKSKCASVCGAEEQYRTWEQQCP